MIQIKENEPIMTLTTLNDLIENKNENEIKEQKNDEENNIKEKSEENIEFNNKIEINEETKPEIKEEKEEIRMINKKETILGNDNILNDIKLKMADSNISDSQVKKNNLWGKVISKQ